MTRVTDRLRVHLCVPVLRRYDLLGQLLASIAAGDTLPDVINIVDNGRDLPALMSAIRKGPRLHYDVKNVPAPLSVAESWNYFLRMTDGHECVISNDDMTFAPHSLRTLLSTRGELVLGFGFSCFLIRTACVEQIGTFDESISPGYAYFEDCDYAERVRRHAAKGGRITMTNAVDTGLVHGDGKDGSSTYRAGTPEEIAEHWRRFTLAKMNFVRKWGAEPQVLEAAWLKRGKSVGREVRAS